MTQLGRPTSDEYHEYYERYVGLVPEDDVVPVLERGVEEVRARLGALDEARAGSRYRDGAWSVKEVLGHVSDVERIFGTRAWAFSRGERQELIGFDQDPYVEHAHFDARTIADLVDEHVHLRLANLALIRSWTPEVARLRGRASGRDFTCRSVAWILAGHERHHLKVLRERYDV